MLDFPPSPSIGDLFSGGGSTWRWDGTKWTAAAGVSADASNSFVTATGSNTPRTLANWEADVSNILAFSSADPTGVEDSTQAVNLAAARLASNNMGKTVYLPSGTYRLNGQVHPSVGQTLRGDGRGNTFFLMDDNFSPSASSVVLCPTGDDTGITIQDICFLFVQPDDVTTRSTFKTLAAGGTSSHGGTGVKYPPAIFGPVGSGRIKVENVMLRGAWDGFLFDTVFWINNIEMGAAGTGLAQAINAGVNDWCFIGTYEHWAYGWNESGQVNIFLDGQTIAIQSGSAGNPAFQGGFQGEKISNLGGRLIFRNAGWSTIANLNNDSDKSSVEVYGHLWLEITNFYYTAGPDAVRPGIQGFGTDGPARVFIHNVYSHSSSNFPIIEATGNSEIHVLGFFVIYYTLNVSAFLVSSGILRIGDGRLVGGGGTHTAPLIDQSGGLLIVGDGVGIDGGTGVGVRFQVDNAGNYLGKILLGTGLTIAVPSTVTNGYYFGYSTLATTGGVSSGELIVNGPAGSARWSVYETAGSPRWFIGIVNGSEPHDGSNVGADYLITCRDDSGSFLFNPLIIKRSTGDITTRSLTVGDGLAQFGLFQNGGAGLAKPIIFQTGGVNRWVIGVDNSAESGGNGGANFVIGAYSDAGSPIFTPLSIIRSTGDLHMDVLAASTSYANDAAAAAGGVTVGGLYRNETSPGVNVVQIRVT